VEMVIQLNMYIIVRL